MRGVGQCVSGIVRDQVHDELSNKAIESLGENTTLAKGEQPGDSSSGFVKNAFGEMAEGIVLAASWFTVRMICQGSYKAIKAYREDKKEQTNKRPAIETAAPGHYGGHYGGQPNPEQYCEATVPWRCPGDPSLSEDEDDSRLTRDDRQWLEDLQRAANDRSSRDNERLLHEIQVIGDKIDNMMLNTLYEDLKRAMKLLIEYKQNPGYYSAHATLRDAADTARGLSTNETSLVLNLSAWRIRVIIAYLHVVGPGVGPDPGVVDKSGDKNQCQLFIGNALKQHALGELCKKFLSSRFGYDADRISRVEREVAPVFDIALEIIASVHILEPYNPSESPVPKDAPFAVILALSEYCKNDLGMSTMYADLAKALVEWRSTSERQDRIALHSLYNATNGESWSCREGWGSVLQQDLSGVFGVTVENGRVTKISLGSNNLEGKLPQDIKNLVHLRELALPNNSLAGVVPEGLWSLPNLRVVALQGNHYTVEPPSRFVAASLVGAERSAYSDPDAALRPDTSTRRRRRLAATVEALHADRVEVYAREWYVCSWKITNTGDVDFSPDTRLAKAPSFCTGDGATRGVTAIPVNQLRPGEDQTIYAMQQAPGQTSWSSDTWNLIGPGLDFVDDEDVATTSPRLSVMKRSQVDRRAGSANEAPSLANEIFVIPPRSQSFHSMGSMR